jgi:hypothetical protein
MPTLQEAYAVVTNAYTGLHQAIHELRYGSVGAMQTSAGAADWGRERLC